MSETNKKYGKWRFTPYLSMVALLGVLNAWQSAVADGQGLSAYGTDMCAEVGIPVDQCSLAAPANDLEAKSAAGDKAATLVEHGRRVCTQEGVPMADCKALPSSYRTSDETILPAASFLSVPDRLPVPDPGLAPPPAIAHAPVPAGQQGVRYIDPPIQSPEPVYRYARPPPAEPDYRYVVPPPFVASGVRYPEPGRPPADDNFRAFQQPVEPPFRAFRQERLRGQGRLLGEERRRERFSGHETSSRCRRAVRYSRPPSYRYVTC